VFDISFAELLLIIVVAVVFLGPKELPTVIRAVSKGMKALRGISFEVKKMFDSLAEESGLKDDVETLKAEVKMIQGDDGNWYESYTPSVIQTKAGIQINEQMDPRIKPEDKP